MPGDTPGNGGAAAGKGTGWAIANERTEASRTYTDHREISFHAKVEIVKWGVEIQIEPVFTSSKG